MSCFKKNGTLKHIYTNIIPFIEKAKPHHAIITVGRKDTVIEEYDCYTFDIPKNRYLYLRDLLEELNIWYRPWFNISNTVTVHVNNIEEVLDIVRQTD